MPNDPDDFFESKDQRPWSRIKDQILGSYMSPYVAKIVNKGQPLLLIDAFAGPGKTEEGDPGSPLIICHAAEKFAKGKYQAFFVNKELKYHNQLAKILDAGGWNAISILGDAQELLRSVVPSLKTQSVFLYIDPFGLDCEFETLMPFLSRNKIYSTEILINLSAMGIHRLAARNSIRDGTADPKLIATFHDKLSRTLGGDYWKDILLADNGMDTKKREQLVVDGYRKQLARTGYLTFTGSCPVQASRSSATKYHMVFASPHKDAMLLFNDAMCIAFNKYMNEDESKDTLFADLSWKDWRDINELTSIVVEYVNKYPGRKRIAIWPLIIQDHFMRFTESEYKKAVSSAIDTHRIVCTTPIGSSLRKTKKLNDDCVLEPID